MIDWVKASIPLNWTSPICGGHFLRLSPDGQIERTTVLSAHCRGSFDEHLTLRTVQRGRIEFDGNPSKFLQGHNVCGSDDLQGLVCAALEKGLSMLGASWTDDDRHEWISGHYSLSRVDVARMFELRSREDCRSWLRSAGELARMRWRGRGVVEGTTLMFGRAKKGGRAGQWSLKGYVKADELECGKKGHGIHALLPLRDDLLAWTDNKIRFEAMLRTGELKRYCGGRYLEAFRWNERTASDLFDHYFSRMELGTNAMLAPDVLDSLKPAVRLAYNAWLDGHDLRQMLPDRTFYRYWRMLLDETDGQIDLKATRVAKASNVVPLVRVLELEPASSPDFLADRPDLLFRRAA